MIGPALLSISLIGRMEKEIQLPVGARVLFQGDSITDGNRGRSDDPNHILGHSYPFLIASRNGADHPEKQWVFINRGISGERVADLASRWQRDAIDLKPDLISILVGINDIEGGTPIEQYSATFDKLLTDTRGALPGVKLVLLEPFGIASGHRKGMWPTRTGSLKAVQMVVRQLASKHHAVFVPLQAQFEKLASKGNPEYWIWDGIHPTYAGQQVVADAWMKAMTRRG